MNFFNSIGNLLSILATTPSESILITTLLLTESFLIYFNIKILKLFDDYQEVMDNISNINNLLKNVIKMLSLLGKNQQVIYDFIQQHNLKLVKVTDTSVPSLKRDDKL